jgi:hypothetical protein
MAGMSLFRLDAFACAGGFSPTLWLGGEEELLCIDLMARGWWLCWTEDVVVQHRPSATRESRARRVLGIRNALWTTWLRRPLGSALRRTVALLDQAPNDLASAAGLLQALGETPWVRLNRKVVPDGVEHILQLLDEPQRRSTARRYVD